MNNTFNINRFGLLIRKQWLEYGKLYLIALGITVGIVISVYGYMYWEITTQLQDKYSLNINLQLNVRWPFFIIFGILFFSLAANHYFAPLDKKPKAILELTLPASSLEKFLVGFIFSCFFALASYILLFYLVDMAFVSRLRSIFPHASYNAYKEGTDSTIHGRIPKYIFEGIIAKPEIRFFLLSGPLLLGSIFILGSLFFKKFQYIKTVISTMVFLGIFITFLVYSAKFIFQHQTSDIDLQFGLSHTMIEWIITVILTLVTLTILIIAYIRFKEKEV